MGPPTQCVHLAETKVTSHYVLRIEHRACIVVFFSLADYFFRRDLGEMFRLNFSIVTSFLGLLGWLSGKESACQCKRCGFNPWVGKIP